MLSAVAPLAATHHGATLGGKDVQRSRTCGSRLEEARHAFFQDYNFVLNTGCAGFLIEQL